MLKAIGVGPCTLRDIAQRVIEMECAVSGRAVVWTVQNALRGGAIQISGWEKRAHAKRWLAIYELCEPEAEEAEPDAASDGGAVDFEQLGCAVRAWSALVES